MPEDSQNGGVRQRYATRLVELERRAAELERRDADLSRLRGLAFLGLLGAGLVGLVRRSPELGGVAALGLAVFVVFVVRHARVATEQFELARTVELVRRGLARCDGSYRAPATEPHRLGREHATPGHPYASDLDVFGERSLFELMDVTHTPAGSARLAAWLSNPAEASVARERQEAARELAAEDAFREALALGGIRAKSSVSSREERGVIAWAAGERVELPGAGLALLLVASLAAGGAAALGVAGATKLWVLLVGAQIVTLTVLRPRLEAVLAPIAVKQAPLGVYPEVMDLCESVTWRATGLARARAALSEGGGAAASLASLDGLLGFAAVRHNALVQVLSNVFLMWDAWAALRLEGWRRRHGARVAGWLDALAEIEALAAIGTFAAEHPTFAWPVFVAGDARFVAKDLGHPLLDPKRRVTNDVELGDVRVLMITGSNMSGKSTQLRAMGVAAVLAHAGAPVCASELTLSELRLWTSMRIDDSLSEGASHFFAEVRRLKAVVDAVRTEGPPVFFLLDEVLHGTNSRERILGAKAVVHHLLLRGAVGAVSSHDLGLVVLEAETAGRVKNVHFQEQVANGTMAF
ncbi:MAG: DNA mismatch repair protein MutS, partial [Deltaproteobacteria bacterium]|nr:DNA mismatch repair protein MutS [Deltaproteobacteria bacterium]